MIEHAVDLVERYLAQVGRRLPASVRGDVLTELRSSLEDGLEARTADGEDARQAAFEMLRDLGPPDLLAASFNDRPRFLVGPELYPTFVRVVGITVAAVSAVLIFAALTGSLGDRASGLFDVLGGLAGGLVLSAVSVFGWVAIVFWVVERLGRGRTEGRTTWDPTGLPPVNDPDRISRAGLAVGLFFLSAFLLVLNVFPDKIVALVGFDGAIAVMPLVGPGLRASTPLITLVLGGMLVLRLVVLIRGRWSRMLRWVDLVLDLVWIGVLIRLLRTPGLLAADSGAARAAGWTGEQIIVYTDRVVPVLQTLLTVALAAALVGCGVALIVGIVRQLKRNPDPLQVSMDES
jgi:MFS family permease